MTRKGFAEVLEWIPRLLLLLIALTIIVILVRYYADRTIDAADLERNTYLYRIYYDDIIMFSDETGRVYPGIVDIRKFTEKELNDVFGIDKKISSCLTLLTSCTTDTPVCHDKATFDQYLPFARFGTLGPGSATIQETIFPITIHPDGCTGSLNITIVRPNS